MNKLTSFSFLLLLISFSLNSLSSAQNQKANFELAERFTTQKMQKMVGSTSVFPRWIDDTNNFWYTYENSEGKNWYFVNAERGNKRLLFDQEEMAAQLSESFSRTFNAKDLDLKGFDYDTDRELFTFHVDSIERWSLPIIKKSFVSLGNLSLK